MEISYNKFVGEGASFGKGAALAETARGSVQLRVREDDRRKA